MSQPPGQAPPPGWTGGPGAPQAAPAGPLRPPPPPKPPGDRRWTSTAAVLVLVLFVTFGGFLVAGDVTTAGGQVVEQERPRPAVEIAPGVLLHPAPGWSVEEQLPEPPQVRLTNGAARVWAVVPPFTASPDQHLDAYITQVLEPQASHLSVSPVQPMDLPSGNRASYLAYIGVFEGVQAPLEGEVAVQVGPSGAALLLDGWAPEGQFVAFRDQVRSMVATAEVG